MNDQLPPKKMMTAQEGYEYVKKHYPGLLELFEEYDSNNDKTLDEY